MRQALVADLRKQLAIILDQMVEEMARAALAAWFRSVDRDALKRAIENPPDVLQWAKEQIRNQGRTSEELLPMPPPDPEAIKKSHRIAAVTYQKRNIAKGKCRYCPKPIAEGSVQCCEEHMAKTRVRERQKKGLQDVGSREYLYAGEITEEQTHGRQPGSLASLALNRERKTRELLAEAGIPFETAAITLNAAKESLLACMPIRSLAMTQAELFEKAIVPSKQTGGKALNELLAKGKIARIGKGINGDPYRYFMQPDS